MGSSLFSKVALLGLMFTLSTPVFARDEVIFKYKEWKKSPYKLAERLATDGSSSLALPETYTKLGVWAEDRFLFPGAPEDSEVLISNDEINGKSIEIIQLLLDASSRRTLEFAQIEAQPRLVLHFKSPATNPEISSVSSIYIKVYIGNRLLDRLRLPAESEWVRKEYALGNAQFLKQKLTLKLVMNCDSDDAMLMLFGYLKR